MRLYERDYTTLLPEEETQWLELKQKEIIQKIGTLEIRKSRFWEYPKAARHFIHLFPNNFLDVVELKNIEQLTPIVNSFEKLLNNCDIKESDIQEFIKRNKAYFIVGSLLKRYYSFGHHEAYLFPEFQLGNSYKVDYLLVGKNSGGWHFVFIELEAPMGKITLKDGSLGEVFRKGINQIRDWGTWIESKYSALLESFDKCKKVGCDLPSEFCQLDLSRIHFIVIAGRRNDFNEKTYRICRKENQLLIHYDNIIDSARSVIGELTY